MKCRIMRDKIKKYITQKYKTKKYSVCQKLRRKHRFRIAFRNPEKCPAEDGIYCQKSLQAGKTDTSFDDPFFTGTRRVFLRVWEGKKYVGSLTVEAAVVVSLFLLAFGTILSVLDIYRVQAMVKTSLHQSALELGTYAYAAEQGENSPAGVVSSAACGIYAKSRLPELGRYIKVSMLGTTYKNHRIRLSARMEYNIPVSIFPLPALRFTNESQVNAWVGRIPGEEDEAGENDWEEMVYVSEYESVYHTHSSCSHLDLAVQQGNLQEVKKQRNQYGGKYHSCDKCGQTADTGSLVYYTEKGDCYHTRENCSGLKRTVRLVKKSEAKGTRQCQRCREKEAG